MANSQYSVLYKTFSIRLNQQQIYLEEDNLNKVNHIQFKFTALGTNQ